MEKKKSIFSNYEKLLEWEKNLSEEDLKILESADSEITPLRKLILNSDWSRVDDRITMEVLNIMQKENVEYVDILLLNTRFSKCYLFTEFDSIMEDVGLEIDGHLSNKEIINNIFSFYNTLLDINNSSEDIDSSTLNIGSYKRLNLPVTPAYKKFIAEQQKEAEEYKKFILGLDHIGREKNIPTFQFPQQILFSKSKPQIRQHFLKGVYNDIKLVTEGKKGSKVTKQLLLKPLIEIIAPDYPFLTEEEWTVKTNQNESETTMSYREKTSKMVSKFIGE